MAKKVKVRVWDYDEQDTKTYVVTPKIAVCWCIVNENGTLLLRSLSRSKAECELVGGSYGEAIKVEVRQTTKKINVPRRRSPKLPDHCD